MISNLHGWDEVYLDALEPKIKIKIQHCNV